MCDVCQRGNRKLTTITPELYSIPVKSPWFHIGIDFVGPITTSEMNNCYILTVTFKVGGSSSFTN